MQMQLESQNIISTPPMIVSNIRELFCKQLRHYTVPRKHIIGYNFLA